VDMQPLATRSVNISNTSVTSDSSSFCRKLSEFHENIEQETKQLDNILRDLRKYYSQVKTKRQLGVEVPAGFPQDSTLKKQFTGHFPPKTSSKD
jgi:hypothetical protein